MRDLCLGVTMNYDRTTRFLQITTLLLCTERSASFCPIVQHHPFRCRHASDGTRRDLCSRDAYSIQLSPITVLLATSSNGDDDDDDDKSSTTTATTIAPIFPFVDPPVNESASWGLLSYQVNFRTLAYQTRSLLEDTPVGTWDQTNLEAAVSVMEGWAKGNTRNAALNIERLLRRVIEEQMMGNLLADNVDMTALYMVLIRAWANSGEHYGAERAEEIMDYQQTIFENGESEDPLLCGPSLDSFNAVIGAYTRSGRQDAPQQAMRVLAKLLDLRSAGKSLAKPNTETYAAVLRAWARRGGRDSPGIVLKFLRNMETLTEYPSVKPDYNCHNAYLLALLESTTKLQIDGGQAARMAEDYLRRMLSSPDEDLKPNTWSFNMVLSCWSRSRSFELVNRAEALMALLEDYHEQSGHSVKTQPNSYSYNALMSCHSRSGRRDRPERTHAILRKMKTLEESGTNTAAGPDTVSYNIVMNAYAKSDDKAAPYIVEGLFRELYELYEKTGHYRRGPNARSVSCCLDAWSRSGLLGSADRIMGWIKRMHSSRASGLLKITPDTWAYNSYLYALAKSNSLNIADEAERILAEMEDLYQEGLTALKPDVRTYTGVIHCIAMSGCSDAVERAVTILNKMEELHSNGAGDVRPNLFTYNCIINTVAKSKRPGKAHLALQLLRRIQSVALKPQTVSFNNVLNACAFSDHPDDDGHAIMQIARDTLKEAQDGPGANWISYQTAIRVVCTHEPNSLRRVQLTREIFQQCCRDGQLTAAVMGQVRYAVPEREYALIRKEATDERTTQLRVAYTANAR